MAVLRVHEFGLPETAAEARLRELHLDRRLHVGLTARGPMVTARLQADGPAPEARTRLHAARAMIEGAWAPYAYGCNGATLASAAGALLREGGRRLVTAESCTGGWLGRLITDVPGSSDYYRGGWITYDDDLKTAWLGVGRDALDAHGAVSAPCAALMASGALERCGADVALAVTGIAGPLGATPGKPAGTVFIALARRADGPGSVTVRRFLFPGGRKQVRDRAATSALQSLRWALLEVEGGLRLPWEEPSEPRDTP